jgi:hypothetical protein
VVLFDQKTGQSYLKEGEVIGSGDIGRLAICKEGDVDCSTHMSAPGSIGTLYVVYRYENGIFVPASYTRK